MCLKLVKRTKQGFYKLFIALLSPILLVVMLALLLIFSPFYLYRRLVMFYVRKYRKDFGKMVTATGIIMAVDDWHGKPECNVAIWFTLKGDLTVKEFQAGFKERVLNLRNPSNGSLMYPELRQFYKRAFGFLFWKWDENFNLNNHIRICDEIKNCRDPLTEEQMIKVNETLLSKPWPMNQSPWAFLLVPNYINDGLVESQNGTETLAILHLHHGMGDGYSVLKMVVGHLGGDELNKVAKPKIIERNHNFCKLFWSSITFPLRVSYEFSKQFVDCYDINAWHLPEKKLARQLKVAKSNRIPTSFIKEIKNAHNVSFSAVLFAATAGGIRNHFIEEGLKIPKGMHVFIPWPFPNHPDDKLRNHVTGCLGKLPLGKRTALERLQACHRNLESMRHSTLPAVNFYLGIMFGSLPNFMKGLRKNYHATGIWGNFPGTEDHFLICGREVKKVSYNVASLHGRTGFTCTVLSYWDHVTIDLSIDENLTANETSAKSIISKIHKEFDVLWNEATV